MRILVAGANRTLQGGAERYQATAISTLARRGHATALVYERRPARGRAAIDDGVAMPIWEASEPGLDAALERAAEWSPDVVYVQGLASPILEERLLARWPGVLFAHGYYGTCVTGTKRHAFPYLTPCTRRFGAACLALHHVRHCGGWNPVAMVRAYARQAARHTLLSRYRAICVASVHMRAEYLRHAIPEERLHVLPLPPTGITRDPRPPVDRSPGTDIVFAARLTNLKGGALLIDAVSHASRRLNRSLSLTVLGEGAERPRLEARARSRRVPVRFVAWVEAEERNRILRAASLLAMPSVWPEPWGLVGLEAACAGVPTVAFAVGGIPEWLASGESGELAPADPPAPAGLADAIVRALGDPAHYARLCRGAWERVGRFTIDDHVEELLRVLRAAAA